MVALFALFQVTGREIIAKLPCAVYGSLPGIGVAGIDIGIHVDLHSDCPFSAS